jgi:hypothetical protein
MSVSSVIFSDHAVIVPGGIRVDHRAGEDPQQHEDDDEQREFVCTCHKKNP